MPLAIFGAPPIADKLVPVGQLYFPSWERYVKAMSGIFDRGYYNNNGPLLNELESKLAEFLGVKHAICVGNATFGLIIVAKAMGLKGKVALPSFTFIASLQSILWAGLEPAFCDVDLLTHQIDTNLFNQTFENIEAIMGVNLWGGACNMNEITSFAKSNNLKLYFDSAHAFGCKVNGKNIGAFGDAEVFSFHATKILSATEGGAITTNNDELANSIRAIIPCYGKEQGKVPKTVINARMSEAQAAIALLSLEDFTKNRNNNEMLFKRYQKNLSEINGIYVVTPSAVTFSNYQYIVCSIDENELNLTRDELLAVLKAENIEAKRYFYPGLHKQYYEAIGYTHNIELANTDGLCKTTIQLPIGSKVDLALVDKICQIIKLAKDYSFKVKAIVTV